MTIKSLLLLPIAGLLLVACSDTTLGSKSFVEDLDQISIPGAPIDLGQLENLPPINVPLNLQDQEDFSLIEFVTSVNARSATITIAPDTDSPEKDIFADNNPDNFDFLSSLTLSLVANISGDEEPETVQVASIPPGDPQIGSGVNVLELVIDDVDVRDFVEAPGVQLSVLVTGTLPPDFVIIDPVLRFRVGVGIR